MENETEKLEEMPLQVILQKIKDGLLDPKTLPKHIRQNCVEVLLLEGHTVVSIGALFKKTDRTVRRDVQEIFERNAVSPNKALAERLIGELLVKAHVHHAYLMRVARSKEASDEVKAKAEFLAWRVEREKTQIMQSLGYLPARPAELVANFFKHEVEKGDQSFAEIKAMLSELESTGAEVGALDKETTSKIEALKEKIARAEIAEEVKQVGNNIKSKEAPMEDEKSEA